MENRDEDLDVAMNLLDRRTRVEAHKCGCRNVTTSNRGVLIYVCAPCTVEARGWLAAYENPHTNQYAFFTPDPRD